MRLFNVSKKLGAGIALASLVTLGGTAYALQPESTSADDKPPIVVQVENHEDRIDSLEEKTTTTETQVSQHANDINALQKKTGTTQTNPSSADSTATPTTTGQGSTPAQNTEPAPAPKHPRTVLAVVDSPYKETHRSCDYTLYDASQNARQGMVIQPSSIPCKAVGEVLPY